MQYILNFFDGDGLPSQCVRMDCKDDRRAIALVELISQNHAMELCQGDRIVRAYRGKPLPMFAPSPLEFRGGAGLRRFHLPTRGAGYGR
jgi:hypothetical protein